MNRKGRPKKENARTKGYRLRMTDEESRQLDELGQMHDMPKSDIIRHALSDYYKKSMKDKRRQP